jgi:hypothetical protein
MLHRAYRFIPDSIAVRDLPSALLLSLALAYLAACALAELAETAFRLISGDRRPVQHASSRAQAHFELPP